MLSAVRVTDECAEMCERRGWEKEAGMKRGV